MLWSEIGSTPQIEQAGMDGSARKVVVSHSLSWPVSLAYDLLDNRVYWADEKLRCIGSASLDGDDIKVFERWSVKQVQSRNVGIRVNKCLEDKGVQLQLVSQQLSSITKPWWASFTRSSSWLKRQALSQWWSSMIVFSGLTLRGESYAQLTRTLGKIKRWFWRDQDSHLDWRWILSL